MVKWMRIQVLILLVLLPMNSVAGSETVEFELPQGDNESNAQAPAQTPQPEQQEEQPAAQDAAAPQEVEAEEPKEKTAQPAENQEPAQPENVVSEQQPQQQQQQQQQQPIEAAADKAQATIKAAEQKTEAGAQEVDKKGIDTVNLKEPQGNWLFKRIWWERAEEKYEKARVLAEQIFELRMTFFDQRSDLDKNVFDPFYLAIGLSQGELKTIITDLLQKIETTRDTLGSLTPAQREFLEKLTVQKAALEQIALDVTAVNVVDQEVEKYLSILMEQMNRVRGYERDAWQLFKEISRELSDKKAREIYFKMDTILKNIASIHDYLVKDFTPVFNKQVETARSQVERLKTAIQELKNKDVDLKAQLEVVIAQDQSKQNGEQSAQAPEEDEDQEQSGFIHQYIVSPIMALFSAVGSALQAVWDGLVYIVWWPIEKIMGTTENEDESEQPQAPAEPVKKEESAQEQPAVEQQPQEQPASVELTQPEPQAQTAAIMPETPELGQPQEEQKNLFELSTPSTQEGAAQVTQ